MTKRKRLLFLLLACVAASAGLYYRAGLNSNVHARAIVDPARVEVEEAADLNVVQVSRPEDFPLAKVVGQPVEDRLNATGSIAPDVSRTVPVISMSSGRVVEVKARLGDTVRQGQPLLTIASPDLTAAFSDYQKFSADELLARRQFERAQQLYSRGAIAQKDLQAAEDTEQKAQVDLTTAAERIRILGGDVNRPGSTVTIVAPVSGVIVEQNVTGAAGVKSLDNSPNLFTIADLSTVWMLCDVYENDLAHVHVGQAAQVRLNAYPGRVFHGRVGNIGQILDPATRAAKVRVELANAEGIMRPNMFGSAGFSIAGRRQPVVPSAAVLRLHDKSWVFLADGSRAFRRREVQPGQVLPNGKQEILAGLAPGEMVVANALALSSAAESAGQVTP